MHKYQPRVHVIRKECGEELSPVRSVPLGDGTRTFSFPETVFTTVTAYQNQQVLGTYLFLFIANYYFYFLIFLQKKRCRPTVWKNIMQLTAFYSDYYYNHGNVITSNEIITCRPKKNTT